MRLPVMPVSGTSDRPAVSGRGANVTVIGAGSGGAWSVGGSVSGRTVGRFTGA